MNKFVLILVWINVLVGDCVCDFCCSAKYNIELMATILSA